MRARFVVDEIGRWSATGLAVAVAHVLTAAALLPDQQTPESAELAAAIEVELETVASDEADPSLLQPAPAATAAPVPEAKSEEESDVPDPTASEEAEADEPEPPLPEVELPPEDEPAPAEPGAERNVETPPASLPEGAPPEPAPAEAAPEEASKEAAPEAAPAEPGIEVARLPNARPEVVPRQALEAAETAERLRKAKSAVARPDTPRQAKRQEPRGTKPEERREAKARSAPPPSQASAPAAEPSRAAERAAPIQGVQVGASSVSPERWQSAVFRHLERHKRYPRGTRVTGTVRVRLTIDARGTVVGFKVPASSGHAVLDEAAASMVQRASPIPAPPPELFQAGMTIEVPIRFAGGG